MQGGGGSLLQVPMPGPPGVAGYRVLRDGTIAHALGGPGRRWGSSAQVAGTVTLDLKLDKGVRPVHPNTASFRAMEVIRPPEALRAAKATEARAAQALYLSRMHPEFGPYPAPPRGLERCSSKLACSPETRCQCSLTHVGPHSAPPQSLTLPNGRESPPPHSPRGAPRARRGLSNSSSRGRNICRSGSISPRTQSLGGTQLSMGKRGRALHALGRLAAETKPEHADEQWCLESLRYLAYTTQDHIHDTDAAMPEEFDRERLLRCVLALDCVQAACESHIPWTGSALHIHCIACTPPGIWKKPFCHVLAAGFRGKCSSQTTSRAFVMN